jgi:L-rhamnose isomerase
MRSALIAQLEPIEQLRQVEDTGDYSSRLALLEEAKGLPWQAVWDYFCLQQEVPVGVHFLDEVQRYEEQELSRRER